MSNNIQHGSLIQIRRDSAAAPPAIPSKQTSFHLFETEFGAHVMLVNGSRVFAISREVAAALEGSEGEAETLLARLGLSAPEYITDEPLTKSPTRSLSLAIAQKCNLGCTYCYAQEGGFGAKEKETCHRFVEDAAGAMGHVRSGVDGVRQGRWLAERHVHAQEPRRSCWARYMCGGGCHREVIHRGRPACDYIRGWLHYCLQAYIRLLERRPEYFHA